MCSCNPGKKKKEKRPWKPYKGKKYRFIKKRKHKKGSGRCFLCGKKGHYAKQCKSKKKLPAKLLQLIQQDYFDDENYSWSEHSLGAVYSLEEHQLSDTDDSDSTTSTVSSSADEDPVLVVHDQPQVDLAMQPATRFRPHIKVILNPSKDSQVALTALIDTGAMCSFIREACVPKDFYVPTRVSFGSASGRDFYSKKITCPIEI